MPLVRAASACALLALVLAAADPAAVAASLGRADPIWLAAALILVQFQVAASAWRWRYTAGRLGLDLSFRAALGEYHLASLLNLTLPGGIAGDVLRTARTARSDEASLRTSLRSVLFERLSGQAAFLAVAACGLVYAACSGSVLPAGFALPILSVLPLATLALAAALAAARHGPPRIRPALAGLGSDLRRAYAEGAAPLVQAGLGLSVAVSYVAVFALAGRAIGAPLPLSAALTLIPLVLLSMLVPVSVGGWGLREGAAALLWPLAGLTASDGAATATLYGLVCIVGTLPGLLVLRPRRGFGNPFASSA